MALALTTELYVDGAWTTYTSLEGSGWSTRIGPDPDSGTQPNRITFTLDNNDGSKDPTNVSSALYGKIGQNTPARIRIGGTTLTQAEASSWQPDRDLALVPGSVGRAWVDVAAAGLLQRLGRWEDPLDSPMVRQTNSYTSLIGHMPLEDASGASGLTQLVDGVRPGFYYRTVTLAGDDGAGGSGPCVLLGSDGQIGGFFATPAGNGYQIMIAAKLPAVPSSSTNQPIFQWADTLGRTWRWLVNNTQFTWDCTADDGTVLTNVAASFTTTPPNQWIRYRVKVTVSGSTLTYEPAWFVQDASIVTGTSATFSSTSTGRPRGWSANGSAWTDGAAYAGMAAVTDTSLDLIGTYNAYASFNGYLGERASSRFIRIMNELGLTGYIGGVSATSVPMGRQKPAKALDLIEECVRTEAGIMYDEPTDIAIMFRVNSNLINQTPVLALTFGVDIFPPFRKVIGDVNVANDITATNWDGTEAHLEATSGGKSTQPPPAGVGRYRKTLALSNAYTPQLVDRTTWELFEGTIDRPRYQQITLYLHALAGSYRTAVNAMRPGDIVSIAAVEPDTVYLRVITIGRSGDGIEDVAVLTCLPADNWMTGEYDDTTYRLDSSSSVIVNAPAAGATSLKIGTAIPGDAWDTTTTPYDIIVSGERITVTAMGAATGSTEIVSGAFDSAPDVAAWGGTNGTFTLSGTFAHGGANSGLLTVTGTPTTAWARVNNPASCPAAVVGASYDLSIWVRSVVNLTDVRLLLEWLDASGATLSSVNSGLAALTSGSWVQRTMTGSVAPAGAVYLRYGVQLGGSPATGTLLYIDDAVITSSTARFQTATVTRAVNGVAKALPVQSEVHVFRPYRYSLGGV